MKHIKTVLLLAITVMFTACSTTLPIRYAPSNLSRGAGPVVVEQFIYAAAQRGKLPTNQPEERGMGTVYLSQDISSLFTDAVRKELRFSGHILSESASSTIGGVIDRFSYDWVGFLTQRVDVAVSFQVRRGGQVVYSRTLTSHKEAPKASGYETEAIKSAMADCIQQFLEDAHSRGAL